MKEIKIIGYLLLLGLCFLALFFLSEFQYQLNKNKISYEVVWEEKFDKESLDTLWMKMAGGEPQEIQTYSPENIILEEKALTIKAIPNTSPLSPYTTGHVAILNKTKQFKEGYIEVIASLLNPPAAESRIYIQTPDKVKKYLHQSPGNYKSDGLDTFIIHTMDKDSSRVFSFDSPFTLHASMGINEAQQNEGEADLFDRYLKLHEIRYYKQVVPERLF